MYLEDRIKTPFYEKGTILYRKPKPGIPLKRSIAMVGAAAVTGVFIGMAVGGGVNSRSAEQIVRGITVFIDRGFEGLKADVSFANRVRQRQFEQKRDIVPIDDIPTSIRNNGLAPRP